MPEEVVATAGNGPVGAARRARMLTIVGMGLSALFRDQKEDILGDWEDIVRSLCSARSLSVPALRDHMPDFFDWLVARIERTAGDLPNDQAFEHVLERVSEGYDLAEVISEYAVLRDCLHECFERSVEALGDPRELRWMNQGIDDAIAFTAVAFARMKLFTEDGKQHPDTLPPSPH